MQLLSPLHIGDRTAPSRVMFGPHVTNRGADDRSLTRRHTAYYERRASGGADGGSDGDDESDDSDEDDEDEQWP